MSAARDRVSPRVTVDPDGRVTLPEPLLASLGIGPGTEFEIVPDGSGLLLRRIGGDTSTAGTGAALPVIREVEGRTPTDEDVRRLRAGTPSEEGT